MEKWELIAPCHFGLEAVLKREILDLGLLINSEEATAPPSGLIYTVSFLPHSSIRRQDHNIMILNFF